jgi:hypothetical protein
MSSAASHCSIQTLWNSRLLTSSLLCGVAALHPDARTPCQLAYHRRRRGNSIFAAVFPIRRTTVVMGHEGQFPAPSLRALNSSRPFRVHRDRVVSADIASDRKSGANVRVATRLSGQNGKASPQRPFVRILVEMEPSDGAVRGGAKRRWNICVISLLQSGVALTCRAAVARWNPGAIARRLGGGDRTRRE